MVHIDLQQIGREVARLRRESGLTQKQLAERARIARTTVARLEVGQLSDLGVRKLLAVLAAVDCTLSIQTATTQGLTLDDIRREREKSNS